VQGKREKNEKSRRTAFAEASVSYLEPFSFLSL